MKLKIYDEENKETPVFLKLVQNGGDVTLMIVDSDGNEVVRGTILTISNNGLTIIGNLTDAYGFPLNTDNSIKSTTFS